MWQSARLVIFVCASFAMAYISRRSLVRPRTHGFVRFFVFELVMVLLLLNAPAWFAEALSVHQLISWALLLLSLVPLVLGIRELRQHGQADSTRRPEAELFEFERTSRLVSSGIFRHIRHPLYTSLLLLTWGILLKSASATGVVIATTATAGIVGMALLDEHECVRAFGQEYKDYMRHTQRFIPGVI